MSRQDDFIEAGIQNHIHHCPQTLLRGGCAYNGDKEKMRSKIFEEGAEFGYTYAINKIAEYLLSALEYDLGYFATGDFVKGVTKFMEEL